METECTLAEPFHLQSCCPDCCVLADPQWQLKALLRRILKQKSWPSSKTSAQKEHAAQTVCRLEAQFIADPTDSHSVSCIAAKEALDRITMSAAERKHVFNKLAFNEEGEQTRAPFSLNSAMPAKLPPSIGALRNRARRVENSIDIIMEELVAFYSDLYQFKQEYSIESVQTFFSAGNRAAFPEQRQLLDSPITLEELQLAVNFFPNFKAPGDDSLPIKV